MVPAASRADVEAASTSPSAAWLKKLRVILGLGGDGIIVLLKGAHAAAVRPLVETLLEGFSPTDPQTPSVCICFDPRELLDVPPGSRVVLVGADRNPAWLNVNRPVVRERSLTLLLWTTAAQLEPLRRNAPDFLDWISHRIEVPPFVPKKPAAEFRRALSRVKWIAVVGAELMAMASTGRREIDARHRYGEVLDEMEAGDILVRGLERDRDLWRLMMAHAQVQWRHRVILVEPQLVPPLAWFVDGRVEGWDAYARRPGIIVNAHEPAMGSLPRVLTPEREKMVLLSLIARRALDLAALIPLATMGFDDVVHSAGRIDLAENRITRERLIGFLEGNHRQRRVLAEQLLALVELVVRAGIRQSGKRSALVEELTAMVLVHLYDDNARRLRRWDPVRGSFEDYISKMAQVFMRDKLSSWQA